MPLKKAVVIIGALAVVGVLVLAVYLLSSDQQGGEVSTKGTSQPTREQQGGKEVTTKDNGQPKREESNIKPPNDKTLRLTIPKMAQIKNDEIPTGLGTDDTLFHDYAGVHLKNTGWPWEEEANVYIAGHRLGFPGTNSHLAFWDLNVLKKGDKIYIADSEGRKYTYVVYKRFIATPNNLSVLKPIPGKNIVTLQTCTLPYYTNRFLVRGELKEISER